MQNLGKTAGSSRGLIFLIIVLVIVFVLYSFSSQFFYFFQRVEEQEVGVKFKSGRITDIVGPGVYSDAGLFVELRLVSSEAVPFRVTDEELITKDKQRIGLVVTGDVFRPGLVDRERLRTLWAQYKEHYLNDDIARQAIEDRARQAMKVCVGDRNFDDAVIGTARDELRDCIDIELDELAKNYGLNVQNVTVPDVILLPDAQARLDEIVQSRLQTEKAQQDELRAKAESAAEQARQEGEIRVEQSRIQEEARQQKILADLERQKIESQKAVIEAESAKAALYANNPGYLQHQIAQANASALNPNDKIIFTPEGTSPTIVLPGPGIMPTINVDEAAQTSETE